MLKHFEVLVAGNLIASTDSKEKAEKILFEAKNSFLALVHPKDCFYIKENK